MLWLTIIASIGIIAYMAFGAAVILGILKLLKYIWDTFDIEKEP